MEADRFSLLTVIIGMYLQAASLFQGSSWVVTGGGKVLWSYREAAPTMPAGKRGSIGVVS